MRGKAIILAILLMVTLLTGCIGKNEILTIRTTGATFPQYQIQKWIDIYHQIHPNIRIEYEGGGSGHGQEAFLKGLTHIGRTDPPVKEDTWNKFLDTGDQPLQFPIIVGAVVIAFNLQEINELKLSRKVLVDIFMGNIEYWDDEAIKQLNPGINLPHEKIKVVHRSDSSGTTSIFTTYLSLISDEWASKVGAGKTVEWPVDKMGRGLAGKGNPGVVAILKQTEGSICYTELSFAIEENLTVASLENKNGDFVKPTTETIQTAVSQVSAYIPNSTEGYKENIEQLLDAPGDNAYPIVAFTHFLVWQNKNGKHYSPEEAEAIKEFLTWILTEGQKEENLAPGYIALPSEVAQIGLNAIEMIQS